MVLTCCAYGCREIFVKNSRISFHSFPKDPERRKIWAFHLKRDGFTPSDYSKICSKHFSEDCFDKDKFGGRWLKPSALPTIFELPQKLLKRTLDTERQPSSSAAVSQKDAHEVDESKWIGYEMCALIDRNAPKGKKPKSIDPEDTKEALVEDVQDANDSLMLGVEEAKSEPLATGMEELPIPSTIRKVESLASETTLCRRKLPNAPRAVGGCKRPKLSPQSSPASTELDPRICEALDILKATLLGVRSSDADDDCATYGNHVGNKLREYTVPTRASVQRRIDGVLSRVGTGIRVATPTKRSDCSTFGRHVGNKLRDYSEAIRTTAQQRINAILSRADMGRYETREPEAEDPAVYGERVGDKIRECDKKTKVMVQHLINNILYQADMGQFDTHAEVEDHDTYGCHVGNKLMDYSKRTTALVQHHINNALFEADIGQFDDSSFPKTFDAAASPSPIISSVSSLSPSSTAPGTHSLFQGKTNNLNARVQSNVPGSQQQPVEGVSIKIEPGDDF